MTRNLIVASLLLALLGCGHSSDVTAVRYTPVKAEDLSGQTFNVLAKTRDESVILLGQLHFDPFAGSKVAGTWALTQWSGPAAVAGLPAGGSFAGTLDKSTLVLRLPLPGGTSLGIVSQGFVGQKLSGTMTHLPGKDFDSIFEAIRNDQGDASQEAAPSGELGG